MSPGPDVPAGLLNRLCLLLIAMIVVVRIEFVIRRVPPVDLCARFGLRFYGFQVPEQPTSPLPRKLRGQCWSVEQILTWWPFARERQCLRRSLALGFLLRAYEPGLCLRIMSSDPFAAHAWLLVCGQHLNMGVTALPALSNIADGGGLA